MSSIVAMSGLTLSNTNKSNDSTIDLNESQNIINNLKLIKTNGHKENSDEVLNKYSNNGINETRINGNNSNNYDENDIMIDSEKKCLRIEMKSNSTDESGYEELYSETSTLSSSPVTSPIDESNGGIDEALLKEKFSKLGFNDLKRYDSPIIQINGNDSLDDEEDDDSIICRAPLLRSTSLKTGKTPPGTPNRKKIVRFADALGLDLESVRHIITDDLPNVPQSAFRSLKLTERTDESLNQIPWFMQKQNRSISQGRPNLEIEFIQPSSLLNFIDRVRTHKVCLENCVVSNSAGNLSITCVIRVLNISFEKSVTLRYTSNEWLTYNEALASYIPNSCDGFSDKFTVSFSVSAGGYYLSPGQRLLFALRYTANTEEYWDNNMGLNYSLIYRV